MCHDRLKKKAMQVPEGKIDGEPGVKQMGPSAPDLVMLALCWKLLWLLRNNMINNTARQQVLSQLGKYYSVQIRHTTKVPLKCLLKCLQSGVALMPCLRLATRWSQTL